MTTRTVASGLVALLLTGLVALSTLGQVATVASVVVAAGLAVVVILGGTRTGELLILAGMVTAPMNSVRPVAAVDFVTFSDIFLVVGFGLLAPRFLTARVRLPSAIQLGAVALVVIGSCSCLLAAEPTTSFNYFARFIAATLLLPLAFVLWRPSLRMVDLMAASYLLGQVVSVLDGAIKGPAVGDRTEGLTTHSNFFGLAGALAIALSLHLLARWRDKRVLWWAVIGSDLLCLYGINLSGSRGAIAVVLVLAVSYPLIERSLVTGLVLSVGAILAVIGASWLLSLAGPSSALTRFTGDSTAKVSDAARENRLSEGLDTLVHHPIFGVGFADSQTAHNIYVEVAAGAGVFGLVAYLVVLGMLLKPLFGGGRLHRLCYPVLVFLAAGPVNNHLWDRFIWAALSLATVALVPRPDIENTESTAIGTRQRVPLHAIR